MLRASRIGLCAGALLAFGAILGLMAPGASAQMKPLKVGIVTFLTGPAAGPFGIPARNAAELMVQAVNAGAIPAPYASKGLGGADIQPLIIDEAGSTSKVVQDFRNLVERDQVDAVVGYISSGSCLAIAPVAEELKMLTVFFDCGTPRIFEDANYHYVFRTAATATSDGVAAALYVRHELAKDNAVGGINQNYAWGQDSWRDFISTMKALDPKLKVTTEQFPKLFAGQYSTEISTLLVSKSQVVHSSLWGGDLESFLFQEGARGLDKHEKLVLTAGETAAMRLGAKMPNGVIVGARGPYGLFADASPLNDWLRKTYFDRYGAQATYPVYHMAQAILGLKVAFDKAAAASAGTAPTRDQVIAAFEHAKYDAFGTTIDMANGNGHQAITPHAYGVYAFNKATGEPGFTRVMHFAAECVNPPAGVKSEDWIKGGMQGAKCQVAAESKPAKKKARKPA